MKYHRWWWEMTLQKPWFLSLFGLCPSRGKDTLKGKKYILLGSRKISNFLGIYSGVIYTYICVCRWSKYLNFVFHIWYLWLIHIEILSSKFKNAMGFFFVKKKSNRFVWWTIWWMNTKNKTDRQAARWLKYKYFIPIPKKVE